MNTDGGHAVEVECNGIVRTLVGHAASSARRNVAGSTDLYRQLEIAVLLEPWNVAIHLPTRAVLELVIANALTYLSTQVDHGVVQLHTSGKFVNMDPTELLTFITAANPECSAMATPATRPPSSSPAVGDALWNR